MEVKIKTFLFVFFFALACNAQIPNKDEFIVESWQKGNEKISEQTFTINLSSNNKEFQTIIAGNSRKRYKLFINYLPIITIPLSETGKSTESWQVELREIRLNKQNEECLGDNLLRKEGIGSGRDNFPREDLIGYLYPKETSKIRVKEELLIDGKFYYPIKAKRKVIVEGFYVIINVKDFQINSADNHKIDFLNVTIEFKNI